MQIERYCLAVHKHTVLHSPSWYIIVTLLAFYCQLYEVMVVACLLTVVTQ